MRKFIFIYLILFTNVFSIAQDRFWTINETRLHENPSAKSKHLGYLGYGAEVKILEDVKNGWIKVESDNFTIGYIKKELVNTSMNGNDLIIKDSQNPIIRGGDGFHGGNHFFVTVAGLKARSLPNKTASIKQVLLNGEAVSVNYFPINPDEWVNIGTSFDSKYAQFVQAKYLGERPIFENLISKFDNLEKTNVTERKTIAERLVELSFNSEREKVLPALNRFLEVANQLNDKKLIESTEFNILIAKNINRNLDIEFIERKINKSFFEINGFKFDGTMISYSDLMKKFGKPTKIETIEDECGIYLSNVLYHYADCIISVDKENNQAELVEVFFKETTKFIPNPKEIISHHISEKDFIIKYGNSLDYDFKNQHYYSFPIDAGRFTIHFKEGKLFSISIMYYC